MVITFSEINDSSFKILAGCESLKELFQEEGEVHFGKRIHKAECTLQN